MAVNDVAVVMKASGVAGFDVAMPESSSPNTGPAQHFNANLKKRC